MYGRNIGDRIVEFGHEGVLYRNSFIMYDRDTESLWVHTTGECIKGDLKGRQLEFLPSVVTTWGAWKKQHPKSLVLEGEKARGFMGTFTLTREKADDFGLSIGQGDDVKLYPIRELLKRRAIHDTFDGEPVVILFDGNALHGTAWRPGDVRLRWNGKAFVDAKGRRWDMMLGQPVGAKDDSEKLEPVAATQWLIKRWKGFYPKSETWTAKDR